MIAPNAPVLGFRAWTVTRPTRKRVADDSRATVIPIRDPLAEAVRRRLVNDPEMDAWLATHATRLKPGYRYKTTEPEEEPGILQPTGYRRLPADNPWAQPGPVRFKCVANHLKPSPRCGCGLHAWLTVQQAAEFGPGPDHVIGAVLAWGHLVMHGIEGFRAEWARIVALSPPLPQRSRPVSPEWARLAANRLGVPCVPLKRLEEVASEHGRPIRWEYRW